MEREGIEVHVVVCPATGTPAVVECQVCARRGVSVRWCSRFPEMLLLPCTADCLSQVERAREREEPPRPPAGEPEGGGAREAAPQ